MKLLVISDTNYLTNDGDVFIYHSVQRELNIIGSCFSEIDFVGWKTRSLSPQLLKVNHTNIKVSGRVIDKNNIFKYYISNIYSTLHVIYKIFSSKADFIHVRGPSYPMFITLLLIPFLSPKKIFWFKYANSWNQDGLSWFWDLQKSLLKLSKNINVTINGRWPHLPEHIIPFENPCFYKSDLNAHIEKDFTQKKKVVFIGRITEPKGVFRILSGLTKEHLYQLESITFFGDGPESDKLQTFWEDHPCKSIIKIIGGQSKDEVMNILKESHFLFLPTTSPEGFPKVIAEAWLNNCIPVVSNVSSIPQYVRNMNTGILWNMENESWDTAVQRALIIENDEAELMFQNIKEILPTFTYEYFGERVKREIFKVEG